MDFQTPVNVAAELVPPPRTRLLLTKWCFLSTASTHEGSLKPSTFAECRAGRS